MMKAVAAPNPGMRDPHKCSSSRESVKRIDVCGRHLDDPAVRLAIEVARRGEPVRQFVIRAAAWNKTSIRVGQRLAAQHRVLPPCAWNAAGAWCRSDAPICTQPMADELRSWASASVLLWR